jgi:hypothetical protein
LKTLLCFMLLTCHTPKREAIPLLVAGQFDAATTYRTLTGCPHGWTCWEVNPALKPFARKATVFPAMMIGDSMVLGLAHRYGKDHRILRKVVIWGFVGLHVWCGVHNIRVAGRYPGNPPSNGGHTYSAPQAQGIVRFKVR